MAASISMTGPPLVRRLDARQGDEEAIAEYLNVALASEHPDLLLQAIADVTKAREMAQLAKDGPRVRAKPNDACCSRAFSEARCARIVFGRPLQKPALASLHRRLRVQGVIETGLSPALLRARREPHGLARCHAARYNTWRDTFIC